MGHGELVAAQGEVVHADLFVAGIGESVDGERQQAELHIAIGQQLRVDSLLVRAHPRHERERVHGEPVGPEADHLLERVGERVLVLARQAVDEIDVDGLVAETARRLVQVRRLFPGLVPADEVLHHIVDILYAHRYPVEPQAS